MQQQQMMQQMMMMMMMMQMMQQMGGGGMPGMFPGGGMPGAGGQFGGGNVYNGPVNININYGNQHHNMFPQHRFF